VGGAGGELLAVEEDLEGEVSLSAESERSGVRSISIVFGVNVDSTSINGKFVSSKGFVLSVFVSRLDGEGAMREARRRVIGSRSAIKMEWCVLDMLVLNSHLDRHWTSFQGSIFNVVGSISIVDNLRDDSFIGAVDLDDEGVSSIGTRISVIIYGMDGETSGLVVPELLNSLTLGVRFCWVDRPFDMGVEWRVLNWGIVEGDIDIVISGGLDLIFNGIGSVSVVVEMGMDLLRTCDGDFEGISSGFDGVAISVDGMDGEVARFLGFSG